MDDIMEKDSFLTTLGVKEEENLPVVHHVKPTDLNNDFEDSRRNLIEVMAFTKESIVELRYLAQSTQNPEAFSALASMINTFSRQQEQLLRMYKMKSDAPTKGPGGSAPASVTNQTVAFVGTPGELLDLIKNQK